LGTKSFLRAAKSTLLGERCFLGFATELAGVYNAMTPWLTAARWGGAAAGGGTDPDRQVDDLNATIAKMSRGSRLPPDLIPGYIS